MLDLRIRRRWPGWEKWADSKERSVGDDRSRLEDIKRQNDAAIRSADAVDKRLAEAPARAKRLADRARREIEKVVHNQNGNGKRHH